METSFLKLSCGKCLCFDYFQGSKVVDLYTREHRTKALSEDFYLICNGRRVVDTERISPGATYHVTPRLLGGKGGFGSMLRAIGAQIEKTTSREACRDLSGRRMRDVNNEKKLREWVAKKADREREREERRQQRLERRRAMPQHKFDDPDYEEQKRTVGENLDDALEEGLKNAAITTSAGHKRKSEDPGPSTSKKSRDWFGEDSDGASDFELDSDNSDSEGRADPGPAGAGPFTSSEGSSSSEPSTPGPSSPQTNSSTAAQPESSSQDSSEPNNSHIEPSGASAKEDTIRETNGTDTGEECKEPTSKSTTQGESTKPETTSVSAESNAAEVESSTQEPPKKPEGPVELDLSLYSGPEELEALGLEVLKAALMARGLKCGGSLTERADRLFSVKGLTRDQIKPALFAKGGKVKGKN